MPLRLSVTPFAGEPLNSIVGRVAARNGATFVQNFCADLDMSWRGVVRGDLTELRKVANLTGIAFETLRKFAAQDHRHHVYDLGGEYLTAKTLNRYALEVCPSCLLIDLEQHGVLGRHCRVEWLLTCYKVCHIHRRPLLALPDAEFPRCPHDFYQRIRDHWPSIRRMANQGDKIDRDLTWETYLANRIRGEQTSAWCDQFDLDLTCHLTLSLGTVLRFGPNVSPSELEPIEVSEATAEAFVHLASGLDSLREALQRVQKQSSRPKPGFYTDFGALARWLMRVDYNAPRFAKILDIFSDFAFENYPFGTGEQIFGRTCHERTVHNVSSAARQHQLSYSRMTSLAVGLGLGTRDQLRRIEFSAQEYDPVLTEFTQCLRPKQAAKALNIKVDVLQRLAKAGLLFPRFDLPEMVPVYHPSDVERFRSSIIENATIVSHIPDGHFSLFKICGHVKCHFEEVLLLAQSGRLPSLCRLQNSTHLNDCYVGREDLRDQIQQPQHLGYSKQEAKRLLRVNDPTVSFLVRTSLLRARMVRHPRSRRPMALIGPSEMDEFLREHATLGMMAHAAKTQAKHVATKLELASIAPIPLEDRFSKIYKRTPELERIFDPGSIQ